MAQSFTRQFLFLYGCLLSYCPLGFSANYVGEAPLHAESVSTDRPAGTTSLAKKSLDLFLDLSKIDDAEYFDSQFAQKIPDEVDQLYSEPPSETAIASRIAGFYKMLNVAQIDGADGELSNKIAAEMAAIPPDNRYIALLKRMWAAGRIIRKKFGVGSSDEEAKWEAQLVDFKKEFDIAYAAVKKDTDEYYRQLELAAAGNSAARNYLIKRNPRLLLSFVDKELRTNTTPWGDTGLTRGQAYTNGVMRGISKDGHIDIAFPDRNVRIHLPADTKKHYEPLLTPRKHLSRAVVLAKDHEKIDENWEAPKTPSNPSSIPNPTPPPVAAVNVKEIKAAAMKVIDDRCMKCHKASSKNEDAKAMLEITDLATQMQDADFRDKIRSSTLDPETRSMPLGGTLNDQQLKAISEWVNLDKKL